MCFGVKCACPGSDLGSSTSQGRSWAHYLITLIFASSAENGTNINHHRVVVCRLEYLIIATGLGITVLYGVCIHLFICIISCDPF